MGLFVCGQGRAPAFLGPCLGRWWWLSSFRFSCGPVPLHGTEVLLHREGSSSLGLGIGCVGARWQGLCLFPVRLTQGCVLLPVFLWDRFPCAVPRGAWCWAASTFVGAGVPATGSQDGAFFWVAAALCPGLILVSCARSASFAGWAGYSCPRHLADVGDCGWDATGFPPPPSPAFPAGYSCPRWWVCLLHRMGRLLLSTASVWECLLHQMGWLLLSTALRG